MFEEHTLTCLRTYLRPLRRDLQVGIARHVLCQAVYRHGVREPYTFRTILPIVVQERQPLIRNFHGAEFYSPEHIAALTCQFASVPLAEFTQEDYH